MSDDLELFCPTCKRFNKCERSENNRQLSNGNIVQLLKCLVCDTEYSLSDSNTAIFDMTPMEVMKGKSGMAHRRKLLETKVTTICCSVRIKYKQAILMYANSESGSVANVTGKVLEKWVDDNNLLRLLPKSPGIQEELEFREDD